MLNNLNIDYTVINGSYYKKSNNSTTDNLNSANVNSDSIEISENNQNVINVKKAHDAFKEACSDFGYIKLSNGNGADMSLYYNRALDMMELQGMSVPSFIPDSQNSTNYLSFVDKV